MQSAKGFLFPGLPRSVTTIPLFQRGCPPKADRGVYLGDVTHPFVSPLERGMRTAQEKRADVLRLRNNSPRSPENETLRTQICLFWTALMSFALFAFSDTRLQPPVLWSTRNLDAWSSIRHALKTGMLNNTQSRYSVPCIAMQWSLDSTDLGPKLATTDRGHSNNRTKGE